TRAVPRRCGRRADRRLYLTAVLGMLLAALRALIQFCTVLPLGRPADFDEFARRSYLYPLGGFVTGGIAALLIVKLPPTPLAAAFALGTVLLVSGFHHFDGLLDFGDGI